MNMKRNLIVVAFFIFLIQNVQVAAEPSINMHYIINDSVSIMDFLCYRLEMELKKEYESSDPHIGFLLEIANKIQDKALITRLETIHDNYERNYPLIIFDVYYDFSSNRLTIELASHRARNESLADFKRYWEKPKPFGSETAWIEVFKNRNYAVGKLNETRREQKPFKLPDGSVVGTLHVPMFPRYEDLRGRIYTEIYRFRFHDGYTKNNYDEDAVKKELIERLRIKIFHLSRIPKNLYIEFSDGNWKKLELTPPKEAK